MTYCILDIYTVQYLFFFLPTTMKSRISDRLAEAITASAPKNGKYSWLESISDIPTTSWKSALSGRQRPTVEMLECFCRSEPDLAFYVVTGTLANPNQLHTSPRRKQLGKMELEIRKILAKEPIDWSDDEADFLELKLTGGDLQGVHPNDIRIAEQARRSKKLWKDFFPDAAQKLSLVIEDDATHRENIEIWGFPAGLSKHTAELEYHDFQDSVDRIESYRAPKD